MHLILCTFLSKPGVLLCPTEATSASTLRWVFHRTRLYRTLTRSWAHCPRLVLWLNSVLGHHLYGRRQLWFTQSHCLQFIPHKTALSIFKSYICDYLSFDCIPRPAPTSQWFPNSPTMESPVCSLPSNPPCNSPISAHFWDLEKHSLLLALNPGLRSASLRGCSCWPQVSDPVSPLTP